MSDSLQKWVGRNRPPRVQITYDVEIGDAIEKKELPLVVGILADLRVLQQAVLVARHAAARHRLQVAADREAVVLAARAGLDPFGLVSALVQLNALGDSDLQFADAHPQSRLRLDHLERAMAQPIHPAAGASAPVTIDERLASHAAK